MRSIELRAWHAGGTRSLCVGFFVPAELLQYENMRCDKVAILRQELDGPFDVREPFLLFFSRTESLSARCPSARGSAVATNAGSQGPIAEGGVRSTFMPRPKRFLKRTVWPSNFVQSTLSPYGRFREPPVGPRSMPSRTQPCIKRSPPGAASPCTVRCEQGAKTYQFDNRPPRRRGNH